MATEDIIFDERVKKLESIFSIDDQESISGKLSPQFYKYYLSFFKNKDRFRRYCLGVKNIFKAVKADNKTVLDIGCGFGLTSILMALLGAKEVVGIDEQTEMIEVFNRLILTANPTAANVKAQIGDALDLSYSQDYFDIVISTSAVCHLRDIDTFFCQARRVLKKGGVLYILTDNNSLDLKGRLSRRRFWRNIEHGKTVDVVGLSRSFWEIRKGMISQRYSFLTNGKLDFLASQTQGMWGEEIHRAVEEFLAQGKITKKPTFKYRDPRSGQIPEAELNPFKLMQSLRNAGFKAILLRPFSCFSYPFKISCAKDKQDILFMIKLHIKRILGLCYPFSLLLSPNVEIIAEKI